MSDHHVEQSAAKFLDNGIVRVGTLLGAVVFFVSITWQAASIFNEIKYGQDQLLAELNELETKVDKAGISRWTRADHLVWCETISLQNKDKGINFRCDKIDL